MNKFSGLTGLGFVGLVEDRIVESWLIAAGVE